jgi:hypothetical protein
MRIEDLVERLLVQVAAGGMTQRELVTLFQNAQRHPTISDEQREHVVLAIEAQLRERFPRSARGMFGPADQHARFLLEGVQALAAKTVDLSRNRVLNRVKTGGDMISGRFHLDVYVSYKNHLGQRISLDIRQERPLDRPAARVQLVQVGGDKAGPVYDRRYEMEEFEAAADDYLRQAAKVDMAR